MVGGLALMTLVMRVNGNGSPPQPWHHIFLGQKIDQALTLSTEMIVSLCLWICLKMNLFGQMISATVKAMM